MSAIAPLAAPVVKPITSGEPSALREMDWKMAPAMPSDAPTKTAVRTRGSRTRCTMRSAAGLEPVPSRLSSTSAGLRDRVPVPSSSTPSTMASTTSAMPTASGLAQFAPEKDGRRIRQAMQGVDRHVQAWRAATREQRQAQSLPGRETNRLPSAQRMCSRRSS